MTQVEVIKDSINKKGVRCTTFMITFPRIILSEVNTHRMLSKCTSSSRAIPFSKMVSTVRNNPFIPKKFMKTHKGMQGTEFIKEGSFKEWLAIQMWLLGRNLSVFTAKLLNKLGVTKQLCNRLLEPYMWVTMVITGTDWENFFALRSHEDAEIHFQELATLMLEKYNENDPKRLKRNEWHIPFEEQIIEEYPELHLMGVCQVSAAMCARTSYTLSHERENTVESNFTLFKKLSASGHYSPLEHVAVNMDNELYYGNLRGFKQLRKLDNNENRTDSRVVKRKIKS